jgi:hypothetical protein
MSICLSLPAAQVIGGCGRWWAGCGIEGGTGGGTRRRCCASERVIEKKKNKNEKVDAPKKNEQTRNK